MSEEVEQLCERAKGGDIDAASRLVTLFHGRVYAYLSRLCRSGEDAEDLMQKTFFKVWTSLGTYNRQSSFSTWIHGIAHHVYVDWRRKRNLLESQAPEWWDQCASNEPSPFENTEERDLAVRLYQLVDTLEPEVKDLIHLHYYQHLSIKEVAEALNIATSTVKYRLRQALDFLKAKAIEPRLQSSPLNQSR